MLTTDGVIRELVARVGYKAIFQALAWIIQEDIALYADQYPEKAGYLQADYDALMYTVERFVTPELF